MNIKQTILSLIILAAALVSCQRLDYPEKDSETGINSFKCFVYYDAENYSAYSEVDVLSGTFNEAMGAIRYTFPDDPERYNDESLRRCRLELSVPSTATVVETDAFGKDLGKGISGIRDLRSATVYFKVVAADGTEKRYQATFSYNAQ